MHRDLNVRKKPIELTITSGHERSSIGSRAALLLSQQPFPTQSRAELGGSSRDFCGNPSNVQELFTTVWQLRQLGKGIFLPARNLFRFNKDSPDPGR